MCLTAVTWYVSGRSGKGDWKDTAKGLGVARVYPGGGQTLEGEQGPVCSLLLSPLPCFCLCFGSGEVGMGTSVFSVRFIVTGFFIVVLKFFVYFIVIVLFLCPVCYCSSPPFLTPCLPGGVRNLLNLVRLSV